MVFDHFVIKNRVGVPIPKQMHKLNGLNVGLLVGGAEGDAVGAGVGYCVGPVGDGVGRGPPQ